MFFEVLGKHAPMPPVKIVSMRPIYNLCEIQYQINNEDVMFYAMKDYIMAGEMFSNRHQVTQEYKSALKAQAWKDVSGKINEAVAITYTPKNKPEHNIYMIVSPQCGYCAKAGKDIQPLAEKYNAKVNILNKSGHSLTRFTPFL